MRLRHTVHLFPNLIVEERHLLGPFGAWERGEETSLKMMSCFSCHAPPGVTKQGRGSTHQKKAFIPPFMVGRGWRIPHQDTFWLEQVPVMQSQLHYKPAHGECLLQHHWRGVPVQTGGDISCIKLDTFLMNGIWTSCPFPVFPRKRISAHSQACGKLTGN